MRFFKHLATVMKHKRLVRKYCFKCGLIWQGVTHDLSKYSFTEFWRGVKYFHGNRSPQAREREEIGYSVAWLHHKGRNKHHFEYWVDYINGEKFYIEMPAKYLAEMVCDRIAASKIYLKEKYNNSSALEYFESKTDKQGMNNETCKTLHTFLIMLSEKGEEYMFGKLKEYIKCNKKHKKFEL